jgi:hypothetical protein
MLWMVPYIAAGGIMWLVAHQLAPIGYSVGLLRAIIATVVMGFVNSITQDLARPYVGDRSILCGLLVSTLPVIAILRLSLWRSLVAIVVYWSVAFGATILIALGSGAPAR